MATVINLNNTTPAPPTGQLNVLWQHDSLNPENVSAYMDVATNSAAGAIILAGDFGGTAVSPTVISTHLTLPLPVVQGGTGVNSVVANRVFAGPASGPAAAPAFRALSSTDVQGLISVFGASGASHSTGLVPDPGATPGTTRFLREDATWQPGTSTPPAGGDTNVQVNSGGVFYADAGFTYNKTTQIVNSGGGYQVGGTATSGHVLRGNGTAFVDAALTAGDIPSLSASIITNGQLALARGGTGSDLSNTGGPGQIVVQNAPGANLTVVTPSFPASAITSGQLALARGGTGSDLSNTGGPGQIVLQSTLGGNLTVGSVPLPIIASINAVNQQANIVNTTILVGSPPITPITIAALYALSFAVYITTAATTSSTLPSLTITWTNRTNNAVQTATFSAAVPNSNSFTTMYTGQAIMSVASATNIQYSTAGYASVGGTVMQYEIRGTLQILG